MKITIDISEQTDAMLDRLLRFGLYGRTKEEIIERTVDAFLVDLRKGTASK